MGTTWGQQPLLPLFAVGFRKHSAHCTPSLTHGENAVWQPHRGYTAFCGDEEDEEVGAKARLPGFQLLCLEQGAQQCVFCSFHVQ